MMPSIRACAPEELTFLRDMLYEAAYWRGDEPPKLDKSRSKPEFEKLLFDWGRKGDTAVVAEHESKLIGAAWFRFWDDSNHSFGYVSADVPELAIAILTEYRGRGVGRKLIDALIHEAANAGIAQLSLSVEWDNPALHLYESIGFQAVGQVGNAYTMVIETGRGAGKGVANGSATRLEKTVLR